MFFEEVEKSSIGDRMSPLLSHAQCDGGTGDESSFFLLWRETSFFSVPSFLERASQHFCCAPIIHPHLQHDVSSQHRSLSPALQDQVVQLEKQVSLWPVRKANPGTAENNCEQPGEVKFSCGYSSPPKDCGSSFQETPVKGHEEGVQWERCSPSPHPC